MSIDDVLENKKKLKTIVYIDYDNVLERFSKLGVTVEGLSFFEKLKEHLESKGLYVCDIVAYANFEKSDLHSVNHQSQLIRKGVLPKHCSSDGKNSGDLEMTVDVLVDLFKNKTIDAFVIVSNDRDFIPLIKTIKKEDKLAILSCSEKGLNQIISTYADITFFFEEMFELPEKSPTRGTAIDKANSMDVAEISDELKKKAQEAADVLFNSSVWEKHEKNPSEPIKLIGISLFIAKGMKVQKDDAIKYLEVAHRLGFAELYMDERIEQECIRKPQQEGVSLGMKDNPTAEISLEKTD